MSRERRITKCIHGLGMTMACSGGRLMFGCLLRSLTNCRSERIGLVKANNGWRTRSATQGSSIGSKIIDRRTVRVRSMMVRCRLRHKEMLRSAKDVCLIASASRSPHFPQEKPSHSSIPPFPSPASNYYSSINHLVLVRQRNPDPVPAPAPKSARSSD